MSIFNKTIKYPLSNVLNPFIYNEDSSKIKILDGSNEILPSDVNVIIAKYGKDVQVLSYEDLCSRYDPKYNTYFDSVPRLKEESIKNCGVECSTPDYDFVPRYKYHKPESEKGLKKIASYIIEKKKEQEASQEPYQF